MYVARSHLCVTPELPMAQIDSDGEGELVVAPQTCKSADRPATILIVEDETMVASYIAAVLRQSGYSIAGTAGSGAEALSLADETRPDLALVDIRLTGPIDGIEVASRLRQQFGTRSIFLSGLMDAATRRRAQLEARPLGFLHKPFRPSQVFNALQEAIAADRE